MGYGSFLAWVAKQGLKNKILQKYLNKAWQEGTKGGKEILQSQWPKLLKKAQDFKANFKTFDPRIVQDKVSKITTKYKTPPPTPKKEGIPIFADSIQQQGLNFFRDLGKKMGEVYGPFGKGTDGFRNMMLWMMQNTPKKTMEVMKQWGYKPKVIPKNIPKPEPTLPKILKDRPNKPTGPQGTRTWQDKPTGKIIEEKVIPTPKHLTPKTKIEDLQIGPHIDKQGAEIIPFPKKPPGKAEGGIAELLGEPRSGYNEGGRGYQDYWTMVQESYSNAGGQDGTEMNIQDFAQMYFPRPGQAKGGRIGYDNGGPIEIDLDHWAQLIFQKPYDQLTSSQQEHITSFKPEKAEGGRIGFKEGEGIMSRTGDMVDMRNVPYYGGKALQGLVNSAETLSKLPLAAGELGSKLIQQPPKKEMFTEAIENITPGSWSENLGLTSLVEGMGEKRPKDAQTVGGILGLGTEIAVPTGGAFKAGQLLLSKASKAMGKVKDGKTLEKLVDQKLTDSGQSRRDFNIMAATGSLVGALKWLGLGGLLKTTAKLKPTDDVVIRLRTWIDDSDVDTEWGPVATAKFGGAFDVESLSTAAQKTLVGIMKDIRAHKSTSMPDGIKGKSIKNYDDVALEDGSYIADILKKAGHKVRFEHLDDVGGSGVDEILWRFKNDPMYKGTKEGAEEYKKFSEKVKKMTERQKIEYHNSLTDDYGRHYSSDVEDLLDVLMPVKKAEGGRIGYDEGGWTQKDFDKYLEDRKKRDKENRKEDFLDDFEKWKKWKKTEGGTLDWAAEGGRIGLQTGGPPITLQRPMFNDGGLTKTIPPERGPDPQGLPSALYNGIMRPRSY